MTVGLTQYEADAYVALVELGAASAVDVAEAAGVPRARIYDVLRSLATQGYVETFEDDGLHARATELDAVRERLEERAATLEESADELEDRWNEPAVERRQISVVKHPETLRERVGDAIDDADGELEAAVTPDQFARFRGHFESARSRGVVCKLTLCTDGEPDRLPEEFDGAATEVRHRTVPTPSLVIVDHGTVVFMPDTTTQPTAGHGFLFEDRSLAHIADWFFRTALWLPWERLHDERAEGPPLSFTDVRTCVREIEPYLEDGGDVEVRIETRSGTRVTGEVEAIDVGDAGVRDAVGDRLGLELAPTRLVVDDGDGLVRVGGWNATAGEYAADRIVVERIDA